jgi:hypothetical protein
LSIHFPRNTKKVLGMAGARIATKDGVNVKDTAGEIHEELIAGAIVGLGEDFKATPIDYAEGIYRTFESFLAPGDPDMYREARDYLIKRLNGGTP